LPREAQAGTKDGGRCHRRLASVVPVATLCVILAGCGGGMGLRQVEADRSILTSAVAPDTSLAADPQAMSDQTTIRNAVSSANLEELRGQALSWANADTQSRGAIFEVREIRDNSVLCRKFRTSRESFEGVALYAGETCLGRDGAWYMRSFKAS
jgi:hypothetical protein